MPTLKEQFTDREKIGISLYFMYLYVNHLFTSILKSKISEIVEVVEFEKSTYHFTSEGIVIVNVHDNANEELKNVKEEHEYLRTKKEYLPLRILVKPGKGTTVTNEVREYVNLPGSMETVNCQAILVDNLAHKIIANFMMRLYKQPNKFKVFSTEKEAVKWLRAQ